MGLEGTWFWQCLCMSYWIWRVLSSFFIVKVLIVSVKKISITMLSTMGNSLATNHLSLWFHYNFYYYVSLKKKDWLFHVQPSMTMHSHFHECNQHELQQLLRKYQMYLPNEDHEIYYDINTSSRNSDGASYFTFCHCTTVMGGIRVAQEHTYTFWCLFR